jgi:arylsulfatase A-like enzyme
MVRCPGRAGCVFVLALLLGCRGGEPTEENYLDLVAEFPYTEAGRSSEVIDLGTPEGQATLLAGWEREPASLDGSTVVWMVGRHAELRVWVDDASATRLRLRCGGVEAKGPTPPSGVPFAVMLNRRRVGTLRAGRELRDFEISLSPRMVVSGENVLALESMLFGARHVGEAERAPREIACDRIVLARADAEPLQRTRVEQSDSGAAAMVLPPRAQVDYFFRAPPAARLRLTLDAARGEPSGSLRVVVGRDGAASRSILDVAPDRSAASRQIAALDVAAGEPVELSLIAGEGPVRVLQAALLGAHTERAAALLPGPPDAAAGAVAAREAAPAAGAPSRATATTDSAPGQAAATTRRTPPPNVLLYVIDTLRADHLGSYGYPRPTSPRIDALARQGVLFERVVAQSSWTKPATASILTGRDPYAHGATSLHDPIRSDVPTLAQILATHGYETAAFVTNVNVSKPFGFARGFDAFTYLPEDPTRESSYVPSDELNAAVFPWLARDHARPFFLYLHSSDPHAPYTPRAPYLTQFVAPDEALSPQELLAKVRALQEPSAAPEEGDLALLVAAYDAEIAFNDASLGALLDELARRHLAERTLVIVTADHGEEFLEHGGWRHGHTLYEEVIRVPLVVRRADGSRAGERRAALARQIDILPTILDEAGIEAPADLPGRSLLAAEESEEVAASREALSHTRLFGSEVSAVSTARWKVLHRLLGARRGDEVFDLSADPRERQNLVAARGVLAGYGKQEIAHAAAQRGAEGSAPPAEVDDATAARLRALGYAP